MDDRTWYIAIGTLVASVVTVFVDAALTSFDVPSGFWTVLAASFAFLGGRSIFRRNGNGNGGTA